MLTDRQKRIEELKIKNNLSHKKERLEILNELMEEMPISYRQRWCEGKLCACLGCCNHAGGLQGKGFTKEEWEEWKNSKR